MLEALQHYYALITPTCTVVPSAQCQSHGIVRGARSTAADFVGAASASEIVFTRNATEAINLVARTWGDANLREGDEVLLTVMEHHSNLVPWQQLSQRTGCVLRHVGVTETGELDLDDFRPSSAREPGW